MTWGRSTSSMARLHKGTYEPSRVCLVLCCPTFPAPCQNDKGLRNTITKLDMRRLEGLRTQSTYRVQAERLSFRQEEPISLGSEASDQYMRVASPTGGCVDSASYQGPLEHLDTPVQALSRRQAETCPRSYQTRLRGFRGSSSLEWSYRVPSHKSRQLSNVLT